ncbi:bone morphogenetic protein 6-like [Stegastes partitus]|uniref:Bone morphogenetic protein 6-like n=1 Tax=Stegastes partitus TaxID=144197 RepID=A0A3B4Z5W9_9TELE|nr:PREDICTED: bone morphogenetic protein 6-like [Stegastes partitus]
MSFAFVVTAVLLGSSVTMAFVLHQAKDEPATSADASVSHHRCQGESLQSIRKSLLKALNIQTEPQLPAGFLNSVREQWRRTFSTISNQAVYTTIPAADDYSVSPDSTNSTSLTCCSMASEIFMKDLGWDSWVIHPLSLTIVQCALCNSDMNSVQCPSSHSSVHDVKSHVPCCQPTSQETLPIVYMDQSSTTVISSMQLTRSCGCGPGSVQQPNTE